MRSMLFHFIFIIIPNRLKVSVSALVHWFFSLFFFVFLPFRRNKHKPGCVKCATTRNYYFLAFFCGLREKIVRTPYIYKHAAAAMNVIMISVFLLLLGFWFISILLTSTWCVRTLTRPEQSLNPFSRLFFLSISADFVPP